jgi:eukaryotic-like serine/threonine-protein kinase
VPHVTPLQPDEPRRIGRYRLTGRVGGLATPGEDTLGVFLAKMMDGSTVIVTLLSSDRAAGAAARDRFTAEAQAARRVPPFCTAQILDAGLESGYPYVVTEYVPGPSLAEVIAAEGPLPPGTMHALAIGCATGLAAIHLTGLVHGHFRPEVVLLSPDGPRLTHFSTTPPYGAATPAADMLAWARAVLFAALGRPPQSRGDLAGLPGTLRTVVAACLNPDPASRPAASAVLADLLSREDASAGLLAGGSRLARAAAHAPVTAGSQRDRRVAQRRGPSRAVAWGAACAACLLAILAAVVFITHHRQPLTRASAAAAFPGRSGGSPSPARSTARASVPAQLGGTWTGTVHQTNPVLSVGVKISLTAGSPGGTVAYPPLKCTGSLSVISAAPGRVTLRQAIQVGRTYCENGVITLTLRPGGKLGYTFARPGGGSPAGTLTRH